MIHSHNYLNFLILKFMVESNTNDPLLLAKNEIELKLKLEEYYAKRDTYEVVKRAEKDNLIVQ